MRRRSIFGIGIIALAITLVGCGGPSSSPSLFVNNDNKAYVAMQKAQQIGQTNIASRLSKIANQPQATWVGGENVRYTVSAVTSSAAQHNQLPVFVAYDIPQRDCHGYSGGGAPDAAAYMQYIQDFVSGLAGHPAIVIVEPDAVAHDAQGCEDLDVTQRQSLLKYAMSKLAASKAKVYLDAGNPHFVEDISRLSHELELSGVTLGTGFALNVSNYFTTEENIAYGHELSRQLGGLPFVIDTGRNGRGPVGVGFQNACNPAGRGLGHTPTLATGQPGVDAYLWIKSPGESDGDCGRHDPPAGDWFQDMALDLVNNAA